MQITFAIPTFDRADVISVSASVLNRMPWLRNVSLRIFDDASSLTLRDLRAFYPTACQIVKRRHNLGADNNCRQMLVDFLSTNDTCLLILDSDLIVSEKLWHVLTTTLPMTDGALSLYNSYRHLPQSTIHIHSRPFILKEVVGAAGLALTRTTVQSIIRHVPKGESFDWRICEHLISEGHRIMVTPNSYCQHIGFEGYNCREDLVDFGVAFDSDDDITKGLLYQAVELKFVNALMKLNKSEEAVRRFEEDLTLNLRYAGRNLERCVRRPIRDLLRKLSPNRPFRRAA